MLVKLYSVFDSKGGLWLPPFHFRNHADAIRAFTGSARDKSSNIGQYPEDFCLYCIGQFDDQKGALFPLTEKETIGFAVEFLAIVPADHNLEKAN